MQDRESSQHDAESLSPCDKENSGIFSKAKLMRARVSREMRKAKANKPLRPEQHLGVRVFRSAVRVSRRRVHVFRGGVRVRHGGVHMCRRGVRVSRGGVRDGRRHARVFRGGVQAYRRAVRDE
jgi:hypothetical protein